VNASRRFSEHGNIRPAAMSDRNSRWRWATPKSSRALWCEKTQSGGLVDGRCEEDQIGQESIDSGGAYESGSTVVSDTAIQDELLVEEIPL
jgi:hypothetical protein